MSYLTQNIQNTIISAYNQFKNYCIFYIQNPVCISYLNISQFRLATFKGLNSYIWLSGYHKSTKLLSRIYVK